MPAAAISSTTAGWKSGPYLRSGPANEPLLDGIHLRRYGLGYTQPAGRVRGDPLAAATDELITRAGQQRARLVKAHGQPL
jgi:hypothetical protein